MRLVGGDAEALLALLFVGLKIAFAPVHVAVTFEGQNVRGDAVEEPAIVADDDDAAGVVENCLFQRRGEKVSGTKLHLSVDRGK